jgi:SOS-response transcriptional repressor LexA
MTRGMKGCYVYFCDKELGEYFRTRIVKTKEISVGSEAKVLKLIPTQLIRVEPEVNDDVKFVDYLPLYSLKAACGAFGEYQTVDEKGWIKVEGVGRLNRSMFVIQAIGTSMEPRIMDGDLCIFRANVIGSRNNKIVLVQHNDHFDTDNEGSYSIKKYTSEKVYDKETGEWLHERIILKPLNSIFEPIIILNDDNFMVIGEFIDVVKAY